MDEENSTATKGIRIIFLNKPNQSSLLLGRGCISNIYGLLM